MASAPVDIPVQVKGLSDLQKLEQRMKALEKEVTRLQSSTRKTGSALPALGKGARGAASGVQALGVAVKSALGPITLALSAIGGLGAAFNTLKGQDFAEAKFESLGGNSAQLVTNLQAVSNELQGTASVAELTGAAYDVASAGFSSAAEASLVLKASSLGATGGFAELNTVANATTSVLNAYGKSAADAGQIVDQFIQTQNDGKIVVAEYAANIGKVASAAAGLGVPLSEVNAVIAQATASGVQADVAFTGLKGALARLASGEATKALEGTGIEIDAASVKADGLYGTLKKLEGLDTGQIFKALGTEAGPALLPVIQNLEKYKELLENQEQANGVAAAAAATAAGTIEGAWKRVTVAFENLFADQSELGQIIRGTLLAAAATVEALAAAFKLVITPTRAVIAFISQIAQAMTGIEDAESILQSFTALWFEGLQRVQEFSDTVIAVGRVLGQYIGELLANVTKAFSLLWNAIANGAKGVIQPIVDAFTTAFGLVQRLISAFYNALPDWLKDALGGVGTGISAVLNKITSDIEKAKASVQIDVGGGRQQSGGGAVVQTPQAVSGGGASGKSAADEAKRKADEAARQLKAAQDLVFASENELTLLKQMTPLEKAKAEAAVERLEIERKYAELLDASKSAEETLQLQLAEKNEQKIVELELEQQIQEIREQAVGSIDDEIARLQAVIAGKEEEYKWTKMIEDLKAKGVEDAEAKVGQLQQLTQEAEAVENLRGQYEQLASGIAGELTGAFRSIIDGSKSAEEALADMFQGIANKFLDMAMQIVTDAITQQLISLFGGLFSSPAGGGGVGAGIGGLLGGSFAGGGYTGDGPRAGGLDGQGGYMAMVHPNETVIDHSSSMGRYAGAQNSGGFGAAGGTFKLETTVINGVEYATVDQVREMGAMATRDGAKQGQQRTMRTLQNSRSQRSKLGMSSGR